MCSSALKSRGKPAVSLISGGPTFDIEKNPRNGANLKLRHALRAGRELRSLTIHFMSICRLASKQSRKLYNIGFVLIKT